MLSQQKRGEHGEAGRREAVRPRPETLVAMLAVPVLAVVLDLGWSRTRARRAVPHAAAGRRGGVKAGPRTPRRSFEREETT